MSQKNQRGVSIVEFCFSMLVLVPMLLGTIGTGLNLVMELQTIELARDAGHMYARAGPAADFSQPGYQTLLASIGSTLGLSTTAGKGSAVLILSQVLYVDKGICASDGKVDGSGNPLGCTNYGDWVFTQRLTIGNSSVKTSNYGSPVVTGKTPVTIASNGGISLSDQVTNVGDVATFGVGINPYKDVSGVVSGLPSGQTIFIAEAAANGYAMPPIVNNPLMYSYNMF
jgi:hypothetical protein